MKGLVFTRFPGTHMVILFSASNRGLSDQGYRAGLGPFLSHLFREAHLCIDFQPVEPLMQYLRNTRIRKKVIQLPSIAKPAVRLAWVFQPCIAGPCFL
jgi:hypothetical protein